MNEDWVILFRDGSYFAGTSNHPIMVTKKKMAKTFPDNKSASLIGEKIFKHNPHITEVHYRRLSELQGA